MIYILARDVKDAELYFEYSTEWYDRITGARVFVPDSLYFEMRELAAETGRYHKICSNVKSKLTKKNILSIFRKE